MKNTSPWCMRDPLRLRSSSVVAEHWLLGQWPFQGHEAILSPLLEVLHDWWRGRRIGEASNPGPAGSRRTKRKRQESLLESFGNVDLTSLLKPLLEKMLKQLLQNLLSGGILSGGGGGFGFAEPAGPRKQAKKKKNFRVMGLQLLWRCPGQFLLVCLLPESPKKQLVTLRSVRWTQVHSMLMVGKRWLAKSQPRRPGVFVQLIGPRRFCPLLMLLLRWTKRLESSKQLFFARLMNRMWWLRCSKAATNLMVWLWSSCPPTRRPFKFLDNLAASLPFARLWWPRWCLQGKSTQTSLAPVLALLRLMMSGHVFWTWSALNSIAARKNGRRSPKLHWRPFMNGSADNHWKFMILGVGNLNGLMQLPKLRCTAWFGSPKVMWIPFWLWVAKVSLSLQQRMWKSRLFALNGLSGMARRLFQITCCVANAWTASLVWLWDPSNLGVVEHEIRMQLCPVFGSLMIPPGGGRKTKWWQLSKIPSARSIWFAWNTVEKIEGRQWFFVGAAKTILTLWLFQSSLKIWNIPFGLSGLHLANLLGNRRMCTLAMFGICALPLVFWIDQRRRPRLLQSLMVLIRQRILTKKIFVMINRHLPKRPKFKLLRERCLRELCWQRSPPMELAFSTASQSPWLGWLVNLKLVLPFYVLRLWRIWRVTNIATNLFGKAANHLSRARKSTTLMHISSFWVPSPLGVGISRQVLWVVCTT